MSQVPPASERQTAYRNILVGVNKRRTRVVELLAVLLCNLWTSAGLAEVTIRQGEYEGRAQFIVETPQATYYFDRAGGGFSRLLDRSGVDWIAFHREPLQQYPASAAAGYRGIPNLVFGSHNPDAGAGHPGFDRCDSQLDGTRAIVTTSRSGQWRWRWEFTDEYATLTILQTAAEHPYWFLYEGPVGGRWSPATHFFGTDTGGPRAETPDGAAKLFEHWQWVYLADRSQSRALLIAHRQRDQLDDTLWYLGNSEQGIDSTDGMVVFGFGRGPGTQPLLRGAGQQFRLGFVERSDSESIPPAHETLARVAEQWLENWSHE